MAVKPKLGGKKRTTYLVVIGVAAVVAFLYYRKKKQEAEAQASGQATGQLVAIEPEGAGRAGGAGAAAGEQGLPGEVGPAGPTGDVTPQAEAAAAGAGTAAGASAASAAAAQAAAANAANSAAAVAIQSAGVISASQAYQRGIQMAPHPSPQAVRGGGTAYPLPVIIGQATTASEAAHGVVAKTSVQQTPQGETFVRIGAPIYAPPGTPQMPPQPPAPPPPSVANYWAEQKALHPGSW